MRNIWLAKSAASLIDLLLLAAVRICHHGCVTRAPIVIPTSPTRLFGSCHRVQLHLGPRLLLFEERPAVLHIEVIPG